MNKKGFEIGVNFLVIMILSIVILGMGLALFTNMFSKGQQLQAGIGEQNKRMIDKSFETGEPVVLIRNSRIIRPGDSEVFNLGIDSEFEEDTELVVNIVQLTDTNLFPFQIIYDETPFTLQPGGRKYMPFKIVVPGNAPKKSYIFDVNVCFQEEKRDSGCPGAHSARYYILQKAFVNVP